MSSLRLLIVAIAALTASCAGTPSAPADDPAASAEASRRAAFARDLSAFIDQMRADPLAPPGFVVVAVHGRDTLFEGAYGTRDLATGAPMTLDTPIYNASVTKAYTGLLAAVLDAEGVLRLDETMTDVWPQMTLQAPLDASAIPVTRLLSHSHGINNGGLQYRSVFTGDYSAAMMPTHMASFAQARANQDYSYSNLGPLLYSGMVEARTSRPGRKS